MMKRRTLIQAALSSLAIPMTAFGAAAGPATGRFNETRFYYDERFPKARRLAGQLSEPALTIPVTGDITPIWNAGLKHADSRSPLTLRGVTTESFHFCLKVLLQSRATVETEINRIDGDLYLWSIRTHNSLTG